MMIFLYVVATVLVFTVIVAVHEMGHMLIGRLFGVGIVEYSIGMGPVIFSKRKKDTCYSLRAFPVGGFCAMYGEKSLEANDKGVDNKKSSKCDFKTDWRDDQQLVAKPWWQRLLIYLAGPFTNVICGFLVCMMLVAFSSGHYGPPEIVELLPGGSAETQGVEVGDIVTGVNDQAILFMLDYNNYLGLHVRENEQPFVLHVSRNGVPLSFTVQRNADGLIGITTKQMDDVHNIKDAFYYGTHLFNSYLSATVDGFKMLFSGNVSLNEVQSVVGVTANVATSLDDVEKEASDAGESGFLAVWYGLISVFVLLSVNIGILNLIPIPALDGGRILFCIIEAIFRRPVSPKVEYAVNGVSMFVLLAFMGYVLLGDVFRLITG